ncbi:HNH endonuclease [Aeromonas phage PZL-Ah8]|uniref:HNH endonuclease n=1 Tax=Aeromonas phage PZL-Ah8 TaxID=2870529 RepID=A0AAE8XD19_9CAUD|nr:HNH endonuclease [Aeromonas phage PZL-Ah8]
MRFSDEAISKLRSNYTYCADTGAITHRKTGREITGTTKQGYKLVQFRINYYQYKYLAHHVAWFFTYGYWPSEIDHINRDRTDNRIVNLREVTRSENLRNRCDASSIQSQYDCVSWHKRNKKWLARLPYRLDRKRTRVGYFECEHEANAALQEAIRKLQGN